MPPRSGVWPTAAPAPALLAACATWCRCCANWNGRDVMGSSRTPITSSSRPAGSFNEFAHSSKSGTSARRMPQPRISMNKILIIEDDQIVANIYRNKFSIEGFQVEIAHDGAAGLETIRSFRPDAVVLDLMLPKMTGVD